MWQTLGGVVLVPKAGAGGVGHAPIPQGRILAEADDLLRLLHGADVGDDEAHGPHVQQLQNGRAGDLLHPGKGRNAIEPGRPDHVQGAERVKGAVLGVDDQIIQARQPQAFRRGGGAQLEEGAQGLLAPEHFFTDSILHSNRLPFFSLSVAQGRGLDKQKSPQDDLRGFCLLGLAGNYLPMFI